MPRSRDLSGCDAQAPLTLPSPRGAGRGDLCHLYASNRRAIFTHPTGAPSSRTQPAVVSPDVV